MALFAQPLNRDYEALQSEIEALCKGPSFAPICSANIDLLQKLLLTHDYIGVCLLLADQLKLVSADFLADGLLTAACRSWVICASHNQAIRHLAVCFLRKREFDAATQIANGLAKRNPEDVSLQIFLAQVLTENPEADKAAQTIANIKARYRLTVEQEDGLATLERAQLGNTDKN